MCGNMITYRVVDVQIKSNESDPLISITFIETLDPNSKHKFGETKHILGS